jgi:hypothetical protein
MIYLIITTTVHNKRGTGVINSEHRKLRYLESIKEAIKYAKLYDIKTIIVENSCDNSSYLDDLGCDVVYTKNNNSHYIHKGVNELNDVKHVIHKYDIKDDDIVIKLTGRYKLLSDEFLKTVSNNQHYDSFLKFFNVSTRQYHPNLDDCVLGLYAIRAKYLKYFSFKGLASSETEFALFNSRYFPTDKLYKINDLHLECCFAGDLSILVV